ncbi:hypothetical protein D3C80_1783160 [compost metagenome]
MDLYNKYIVNANEPDNDEWDDDEDWEDDEEGDDDNDDSDPDDDKPIDPRWTVLKNLN